jgi:hypothetical protein
MASSHVRYQVTRVLHLSANREEEMAVSQVMYQVTRVFILISQQGGEHGCQASDVPGIMSI